MLNSRSGRLATTLGFALLLQGCVINVNADSVGGDVSRVFGSIDIARGQTVGDVESVNGGIDIEDDATAEDVETVNGSIKLGDNVRVDSLETVNGSIRAGHGLEASGDVETVNGRITLRENSRVGRDVSTVNGEIDLEGVAVEGSVETVNGDILLAASVVGGDVVFEDNDGGWWKGDRDRSRPRLRIDGESVVRGDIILYRDVKLDIDADAEIGDIVRRYDER